MELTTSQHVEEEASRSLLDMARDVVLTRSDEVPQEMAIVVRDDSGLVLRMKLTLEIERLKTTMTLGSLESGHKFLSDFECRLDRKSWRCAS